MRTSLAASDLGQFTEATDLTRSVPRIFERVDEGHYRLTLPDLGIQFEVDRLRRRWDQLQGELTVSCDLAGAQNPAEGVLHCASFNLSDLRARQERARHLAERANAKDLDWLGLLEEFVQRVLHAERTGEPSVLLHEIPRPGPAATVMVAGFLLLLMHWQILFAPGGAGKSLLGLYLVGELARGGKRIMVLDWELDGTDQRARADALGLPPTIRYRRCTQPLVELTDDIRREVVAHEIDFLLIDSVAPACHGPAEDSATAIGFFQALRRIGVGGLAIAHTRAEDGEQRPFGSTFWHNLARSTWFVKRVIESAPDRIALGIFNRKANLGPLRQPFGLELRLTANAEHAELLDRVTVHRIDAAAVEGLAGSLPLRQRIQHALKRSAMTVLELATELDEEQDTVRRTLNRGKQNQIFTLITTNADGVHRWGLCERRPA